MVKFISCDWGTTSFRLKLVDTADLAVLAQLENGQGIARTNLAFLDQYEKGERSRETYFRRHLVQQVSDFQEQSGQDLKELMIICSGMASSSIGLKELPFAELPFQVSGRNLPMDFLGATAEFSNSILLLTGLKSNNDVIRGEETQLVGIIQQLRDFSGDGIFVLPGTHSKHIRVMDGAVVNFSTYMTGEFFDVLGKHSILKNSIQTQNTDLSELGQKKAFQKGVEEGFKEPLLSAIFSVRTMELFQIHTLAENYHYLSGILIGSEARQLAEIKDLPIFLCATSAIFNHYSFALELLGISCTVVPEEMVAHSVVSGQYKIFNQNLNHERSIFLGSF